MTSGNERYSVDYMADEEAQIDRVSGRGETMLDTGPTQQDIKKARSIGTLAAFVEVYGHEDFFARRRWQIVANCRGVDPDLFFPERGASTREAKAVCRGCEVRPECLEYALAEGERFGIWGGLSERERRRVRRQRALERRGR